MNLSQTEVRRRITRAMQPHTPSPSDYSLSRALLAMLNPRGLQVSDGPEGELAAAAAESMGRQHDPHRIRWPLEHFRRDLNTAAATQGGSLVATDAAPPWEPLRPWSVVLQGGATVWPGLQGDVVVPRVIADPVAYWVASETSNITEGQHTLGQTSMEPKLVACYVEVSRQLLLQALRYNQFESLLASTMLRPVGKRLDQAIITGSGASGEPSGLAVTAGVGAASGTSLNWASVVDLRTSAVDAIGNDRNVSWVGGAGAQATLSKRERFSGGGHPIWNNYEIAGIPAYVSNAVPYASLVLGDWSQVIVGMWGDSVQVEINPYANFPAGIVGFRVCMDVDVHVVNPAYFSIVQSIT